MDGLASNEQGAGEAAGTTMRPGWSALRAGILLAGAGLLLGWGVWSCQTPATDVSEADRPPAKPAAVPVPTAEPEMRVRIRTGVQMARIDGVERFKIAGQGGGGEPTSVRGPLVLAVSPSAIRVTDGLGRTHDYAGGVVTGAARTTPSIEITAEGAAVGEGSASRPMMRVDGKAYPGRMRAIWRPARSMGDAPDKAAGPAATESRPAAGPGVATLDLIEFVPLETYISGVISKELYSTWPLGAFEVQAVCARTYALHERERSIRGGEDFDVESSTLDQAYDGSTSLGVAQRATANTRGVVMTWKGQLLRTYYSSTCGGRPASAADIWPTTSGYEFNLAEPLQGKARESACDDSPAYRWDVARDVDELSARVREWGRATSNPVGGMATIRALKVKQANALGRPTHYWLVDTKGKKYDLQAEEWRVACNYAAPGLPAITTKTRVRSGDVEVEVKGEVAIIHGRGFGHGVGMCQFCTKAFAERGDTWRQMLSRYYPGAKMERIY